MASVLPLHGFFREGGACVATSFLFIGVIVEVPLADSRRIEMLANGMRIWQGARVAVNTTLVTRPSQDGPAHVGAYRVTGKAAAPRGVRQILDLVVVVGIEIGNEVATLLCYFSRPLCPCTSGQTRRWHGLRGGLPLADLVNGEKAVPRLHEQFADASGNPIADIGSSHGSCRRLLPLVACGCRQPWPSPDQQLDETHAQNGPS